MGGSICGERLASASSAEPRIRDQWSRDCKLANHEGHEGVVETDLPQSFGLFCGDGFQRIGASSAVVLSVLIVLVAKRVGEASPIFAPATGFDLVLIKCFALVISWHGRVSAHNPILIAPREVE